MKSAEEVTTPFSQETEFKKFNVTAQISNQRTPKIKLSDSHNLLHRKLKLTLLVYTCITPQSFPTPKLPTPRNSFHKQEANALLNLQSRVYFLIEQRATKKWVVTASHRDKPEPIESDLQHKQ